MATGVLNVGVSGLNAAQAGVLTTSHNISNASTPGFSRQKVEQTTNTPMFTGAGFLGQGTSVETIQRIYSQFVSGQLLSAQTGAAEMDTYLSQISQIDNLLADPEAGLSPTLSEFFTGVQAVAANPASVPARQSMLSTSQALAGRFQLLDQRLSEIRVGVNAQVASEVTLVNSYARQIAEINQRIAVAQASGPGQPANDLLDQRDQLVADINKEIRASIIVESDGSYSVFIGNGQPVVVGTDSYAMQALPAPDEPERTVVALKTASGEAVYVPETLLSGGNLGGLIAFRREMLDPVQNGLGRVALTLAQTFNEQHRLGLDLMGVSGGDYFAVPVPTVFADSTNATQTVSLSAQIVSSDYRVTFGAANAYSVYRLTDTVPRTAIASGTATAGATTNLTLDGIPITITLPALGAAGNGDSFLIRPGNPAGSRIIGESDNTGNATLDSAGSNLQALTTSDYRLDVTAAGAGNYLFNLTRMSDSQSWTGSGTTVALALSDLATRQHEGLSFAFTGTPITGDGFLIHPTRVGAANIGVAVTDPRTIAVAAPIRTAAGLNNQGKATISAGSVEDKSYLPLSTPVTLAFDSANKRFVVTGATPAVANVAYDPATLTSKTISFNGLSFTISGTPAMDDVFTVSASPTGVADNRNALLLGALQTQNTMESGTATYQSSYARIVSQVGNKTREVEVAGEAQNRFVEQTQKARDAMSGVNLDEEAANLIRYQQAYQAAAKVIDVARSLFDEILSVMR